MTDYPTDETLEVLRSLIQMCKNEKIAAIKIGPIEFNFQGESEAPKPMSKEEAAMRSVNDLYAASGYVPVDLASKASGR